MRKILPWLAASALVMFALPWLAVTFVGGDGGMAVCFLLFFAVNPAFSLLLGTFAGRELRRRWWLPLLPALFFLGGAWTFFDRGEPAFLLYAGIYLALGIGSMLLAALVRKKNRRREP